MPIFLIAFPKLPHRQFGSSNNVLRIFRGGTRTPTGYFSGEVPGSVSRSAPPWGAQYGERPAR